ncbi:MAG: hypothetical protein U9R08_02620 [Nanoarchaeota archaeon]|nr:hypothetical protein [Nanoarchaeota archaeon]
MHSLEKLLEPVSLTQFNLQERRNAFYYNTLEVYHGYDVGQGFLLTPDGYFVTLSNSVGRGIVRVQIPGTKNVQKATISEKYNGLALGKIDVPETCTPGLVVLKTDVLQRGAPLEVYFAERNGLVSNVGAFRAYSVNRSVEIGTSSCDFESDWNGAPVATHDTHEFVGLTVVKPEPERSLWNLLFGKKEIKSHEFIAADQVRRLVNNYLKNYHE